MTGIKRHRIKLLLDNVAKGAFPHTFRPVLSGLVFLVLASFALADDMNPGAATAAAKENPYSAKAKIDLGLTLVRAGNGADAEKLFREALQDSPDPVRAHYGLGLIYEKQGDFVRSIAEYKEGIRKLQQGRK